jgi:glycosyltransferase involved in cell wall biosynthesis
MGDELRVASVKMPGSAPVLPGPDLSMSVIVPVHGNARELSECVEAVRRDAGIATEIIVVDDASPEDLSRVGERFGARVVRLDRNSGPAAARNHGAGAARGAILFFVDADVIVAPGAIERVACTFASYPDVAAVFGSYDSKPRARGLVSQYRNLLHHFMHQTGNREASTFWAGCGAIRRVAFEAVGGFDPQRFPRPSIEDIELGVRLRRAGYRILLDPDLQGTHLKRWTLTTVVRTDVFSRALPWSRLVLENRDIPNDLNLRRSQRFCGALVMLAGLGLAASPIHPGALPLAVGAAAAVVLLNRDLFAFFARRRGLAFAGACVPLHLLYYLYSSLTYLYVWVSARPRGAVRKDHGSERQAG